MFDGTTVYTESEYKTLVEDLIYYRKAYEHTDIAIYSAGKKPIIANTYTLLGTLPSDYRPNRDIFEPLTFLGGDYIGFINISHTDGTIKAYCNNSTNYYTAQITY